MRTQAPPELGSMGLNASEFVRSCSKSWRGPCPRCGGHRHLLVFTDHPFPKWHVQCDHCGLKAWADQLNTALRAPVDEDTRRRWAEDAAREAQARAAYRAKRLAEFSTAELWQEYHARMGEAQRSYWRDAGIPDDWQVYYSMGYTPSKEFAGPDGALFTSPAYTIPIFDYGRKPVNMQYRIVNVPEGAGKYRQESGLPAAAFLSNPDAQGMTDSAVIVEGSKKAAVVNIWTTPPGMVIGVPGLRSWAGIAERVKDCGRVWVVLDPDAGQAAVDLCRAIGNAARLVSLPAKPDDYLLALGDRRMGAWNAALKQGRKV